MRVERLGFIAGAFLLAWKGLAAGLAAGLQTRSRGREAAMLIEINPQLEACLDPIAIEIDSGLECITQDALDGLGEIKANLLAGINALAVKIASVSSSC